MKKIKIAYIVGSLTCGGAEKQVVSLLNSLDRNFFDLYLIVLWPNMDLFSELKHDVNLYALQFRKKYFFYCFLKLIFFIYKNKINIIHSHMYKSNLIASISTFFNRKCILVTGEHGKNTWKKWIHHVIEKKIINKKSFLRIAASKDIRNLRIRYDGVDPEKIIYVPNGTCTLDRQNKNFERHPYTIGFLGRIEKVKDLPTMIFAFKILLDKGYSLKLNIAGQGADEGRIRQLIVSNGLESDVKLVGFQESSHFLQSIDIFAMSSLREGIPLALLEAMALSLPCVVTDVGGIPDVVTHGVNGLLAPPGDPSLFASMISRYVDDKEFRIINGINAAKTIREEYSIQSVAQRYNKIYKDLYYHGRLQC
ncbi:glycosyltransferase [Desulfoplanes sp.]